MEAVAVKECRCAVQGKKNKTKKQQRVLQLSRYLPTGRENHLYKRKTIYEEEENWRNTLLPVYLDAIG